MEVSTTWRLIHSVSFSNDPFCLRGQVFSQHIALENSEESVSNMPMFNVLFLKAFDFCSKDGDFKLPSFIVLM